MKTQEEIPTSPPEKYPVQLRDSSDCGALDQSEDDFSCSDQIIIRRPKIKTRFNSVFDTKEDKVDNVLESLNMDNDYRLCVDNPKKFAEYLVLNNCLDIYKWLEASMKEGICVDKKCNQFYKIEKALTRLNPRQIENIHQKNLEQRELEIIKQGAQLNRKKKNEGLNQIRDVQILFDQTKFNQEQAKLKIIQEKRRRQHHINNLKYIRENLPQIYGSNIKIEDARQKIQQKEYELEQLRQYADINTYKLAVQDYANFEYYFNRREEKKIKLFHDQERRKMALKKDSDRRKKLIQQQELNGNKNGQINKLDHEIIETSMQKKIIIEEDYELSDNGSIEGWKKKTEQLEQKLFIKMQNTLTRQSERLALKRLKQLEDLYKSQPKPFIIIDMDSDSDSDSYYEQQGNPAKLRFLQPVFEIEMKKCSIPILK